MASYGKAAPAVAPHPANYGAPAYAVPTQVPVPVPGAGAPPGTFPPGTKIQVGSHRVVIQKYLSEGGFAHVYLVRLPQPVHGTDLAVLKRVAVPDKEALRGMRTEVETMKRLKGHRAIVTYIDSHASELRGGGYEVFLLMEYCNGGGLIDFMNTRLQHRLTEPEILAIFADVAEGVACMHYLRPPLLHRDLKVENVLITLAGNVRRFKLCDFGSAAPPRPAPTTTAECRAMDEDVQRHTTMQYRSPEMVDVYRKLPIDEKSDIWALGVLLYKLCYYTTPFEDQGQLAILNASYRFPSHPVFSDRLKGLIAWMLRESPQQRPNIYQVLREACAMQGREPPIKDIYSGAPQPDAIRLDKPLPNPHVKSPPMVGAVFSPQAAQPSQPVIPEVERMRRGRVPAAQPSPPQLSSPQPNRPSPSPARVTNGDPFAALDARPVLQGGDELSSRFPTLDQFTLLHDRGQKFDFDEGSLTSPQLPKDLSQRVTERLADEAFRQVKPSPVPAAAGPTSKPPLDASRVTPASVMSPPLRSAVANPSQPEVSRASVIISNTPELQALSAPTPAPPPKPAMVSVGTMTSPDLDPGPSYPIHRFPTANERHRAASLPRPAVPSQTAPSGEVLAAPPTGTHTVSLQGVAAHQTHQRHPSSSRPSLEGGRPDPEQPDTVRPRSRVSLRPRPVSTHLESNLDFLREQEARSKSPALPSPRHSLEKNLPPSPTEETNIQSNVEFLRSMEDPESKKKDKSRQHLKRGSLSSLTAGTKSILSSKFGDAFKRFESNSNDPPPARTPSPLKDLERRELTPIPGSETVDGRSDDGRQSPNWEDMTPEMRREHEARLLAQEEARVAAAQAEYRQRLEQRGGVGGPPPPPPKSIGGVSRVTSIQNKVQSLIEESNRSAENVTRTATGYGHYTDAPATASKQGTKPAIPRKPVGVAAATSQLTGGRMETSATGRSTTTAGAAPGSRPAAPPKPTHLNKPLPPGGGARRPPSPTKQTPLLPNPASKVRSSGTAPSTMTAAAPVSSSSGSVGLGVSSSTEALLAVNLPGGGGSALLAMTAAEKDDYIRDFQKRFPSLGAIEMVERDLAAEEGGQQSRGR
ncbi:hypothetical protein VTJ49DRAFT_1885 [Mycothermus thermophilus]|uniref:non-specific serine/threonine protein kinase n=1 Tax=Humicola insolens TaxID=85995 RepID=A0ABR3VB71_HUMIN